MGNNPSHGANKRDHIKHIYSTASRKANQIQLWYKEERFRELPDRSSQQLVSYSMSKSIQLLIQGRSIGTTGVSKILSVITPLKFINKV